MFKFVLYKVWAFFKYSSNIHHVPSYRQQKYKYLGINLLRIAKCHAVLELFNLDGTFC